MRINCAICKKKFHGMYKYFFEKMEICEECNQNLVKRGVIDDQW